MKKLVVVALALALFGATVTAQDVTVEPTETVAPTEVATVEVTVEPPVEPAPDPEEDRMGEYFRNALSFLLGLVGGGTLVLVAVGRLKEDKSALDAIEWLGKSVPVEALQELNKFGHAARDAGDVLVKVTDGLPNE